MKAGGWGEKGKGSVAEEEGVDDEGCVNKRPHAVRHPG